MPFRCAEASTTTDATPLKLVRVKFLNKKADVPLDVWFPRDVHVPSLKRLNDGSWEILVEVGYTPTFQNLLREVQQIFVIHDEYDPLAPLAQDIQYFGLENAQTLSARWFLERVEKALKNAPWIVASTYAHVWMQRRKEIARHIGITGV